MYTWPVGWAVLRGTYSNGWRGRAVGHYYPWIHGGWPLNDIHRCRSDHGYFHVHWLTFHPVDIFEAGPVSLNLVGLRIEPDLISLHLIRFDKRIRRYRSEGVSLHVYNRSISLSVHVCVCSVCVCECVSVCVCACVVPARVVWARAWVFPCTSTEHCLAYIQALVYRNRELEISTEPTKAKSRELAYSQALPRLPKTKLTDSGSSVARKWCEGGTTGVFPLIPGSGFFLVPRLF